MELKARTVLTFRSMKSVDRTFTGMLVNTTCVVCYKTNGRAVASAGGKPCLRLTCIVLSSNLKCFQYGDGVSPVQFSTEERKDG